MSTPGNLPISEWRASSLRPKQVFQYLLQLLLATGMGALVYLGARQRGTWVAALGVTVVAIILKMWTEHEFAHNLAQCKNPEKNIFMTSTAWFVAQGLISLIAALGTVSIQSVDMAGQQQANNNRNAYVATIQEFNNFRANVLARIKARETAVLHDKDDSSIGGVKRVELTATLKQLRAVAKDLLAISLPSQPPSDDKQFALVLDTASAGFDRGIAALPPDTVTGITRPPVHVPDIVSKDPLPMFVAGMRRGDPNVRAMYLTVLAMDLTLSLLVVFLAADRFTFTDFLVREKFALRTWSKVWSDGQPAQRYVLEIVRGNELLARAEFDVQEPSSFSFAEAEAVLRPSIRLRGPVLDEHNELVSDDTVLFSENQCRRLSAEVVQ